MNLIKNIKIDKKKIKEFSIVLTTLFLITSFLYIKFITGKYIFASGDYMAPKMIEESVKNPKKYIENNYENSKILFETCIENKLTNIVFSSTGTVYGNENNGSLIKESSKTNPVNPYSESKLKTEQFLLEKSSELNFIILRYFNVAGADPKLRTGLISDNPSHLIKIASEAAIGKKVHQHYRL